MNAPLALYEDGQSTTGYWRSYAFDAAPGSVWVQRVETEVTCWSGGDPWLRFTNRYAEFFVLDVEGGLGGPELERPWLDLHAFDVLVDGWGRSGLRDWLATQPGQTRRPASALSVRKRFELGPGVLDGVELPSGAAHEGAFGYLERGPEGARLTRLEFCLEPQASVDFVEAQPAQGAGAWAPGPRWTCEERYRFSYATLGGTLEGYTSYEEPAHERTAS